jgi:hypothetical protein
VLRVRADRSYANLSHKLARTNRAYTLRWRWRLDQTLAGADLRTKNGDDTPVKVCALYDLPLEKLGFVDRNILRMARTASGEYLPGATLCYVWDQKLPVGADADNTAESSLAYVGDVALMEQ